MAKSRRQPEEGAKEATRQPERRLFAVYLSSTLSDLRDERAGTSSIPRLMFLKSEDAVPFSQTDAKTKEHPPERIEEFRQRAGGGEDQRPAIFSSVVELRERFSGRFTSSNAVTPWAKRETLRV